MKAQLSNDVQEEDGDVGEAKDQSDSECNSEPEILSKPEYISNECVEYISQVDRSVTYLMYFKEELDKVFTGEGDVVKMLNNVFRTVEILKSAYIMIMEIIAKLKSRNSTFYLYEVLLDPLGPQVLNMYKPFLNDFAVNAKWMGDFCRQNKKCQEACMNMRRLQEVADNVNIDNCLYTAFNSLFSMELMFTRYRNSFEKLTDHYQKADEAVNLISNFLKMINTNQDQANFLVTQKELSLLSGRSRDSRINTRFIYKGVATMCTCRDDQTFSRQLVLFTDCLYVTLRPRNIFERSRIKQEFSISSMMMTEVNEDEVPNTHNLKWGLSISAKEAVQDFFFDSEQTMKIWKEKLFYAIKEESGSTIEAVNVNNRLISLGLEAPRWQNDDAASYCNGFNCTQRFNSTVRRHHCRADGLLYCDSCCSFKVNLTFKPSLESRVCDLCFSILSLHKNVPILLEESKKKLGIVLSRKTHVGKKTGWLFVRKYNKDKSIFMREIKRYCELDLKDAFLKLYERHEDKHHSEGIILLGMEVRTVKEGTQYYKSLSPKQLVIQNTERSEVYLMKASSQDECQSWVQCLQERINSVMFS